jgi:hypothetical protein
MKKRLSLPERACECGCGRTFVPARRHHRFFSDDCRKKAWLSSNSGPIAIAEIKKENAEIKARLSLIERKLGIKKGE